MRFILFAVLLIASVEAVAGNVAGPPRYYVDGQGRFIGVFHNSVDETTGVIQYRVAIPNGAVLVPTSPPSAGMQWSVEVSAWVIDSAYVAPFPEVESPDTVAVLELLVELLVERGVITEEDKNSLIGE